MLGKAVMRAAAIVSAVTWLMGVPVPGTFAAGADLLARPSLAQLVPQGTRIAALRTWKRAGHEYAVAATGWSRTQPTPWMIVAKLTASGRWEPLYVGQTQNAFSIQKIAVSPGVSEGTAVCLSFIVDAATGRISNTYTLWVTPDFARVVARLPDVVALSNLAPATDGFQIEGLNLKAVERVKNGRATVRFTPLRALLAGATHPVEFVMGWTNQGGKTVKKIFLLGPEVLHAHVGDTLSFVPMNSQAVLHMLGSASEQGGFAGISVYGASPGAPLGLYQTAQEFANIVRLTQPGSYSFAIVPPDYRLLAPDGQAAVLRVVVQG